ncbi:MAG TPA: hypothetical protein VK810_05145 [Dongiaceae bacterium]|nr:hypothetical protein [Dongiaceae bacterium]
MKTKIIILALSAGIAVLVIAQPTATQPGSPSQGANDVNGNNPGAPPVYSASTNGINARSSGTNDWSNTSTNMPGAVTNRPHQW